MSDNEFDDLEAEYEDAQVNVKTLKEKYQAALIARAPLKVGDIVVSECDGSQWRVARLYFCYAGLDYKFNAMKKDGSFGTAERNLYGKWKKKE